MTAMPAWIRDPVRESRIPGVPTATRWGDLPAATRNLLQGYGAGQTGSATGDGLFVTAGMMNDRAVEYLAWTVSQNPGFRDFLIIADANPKEPGEFIGLAVTVLNEVRRGITTIANAQHSLGRITVPPSLWGSGSVQPPPPPPQPTAVTPRSAAAPAPAAPAAQTAAADTAPEGPRAWVLAGLAVLAILLLFAAARGGLRR